MSDKKYGLLFPGQGSQKVGMGKDLYDHHSAARWVFDKANEISGRDIKKLCFEGPEEDLTLTANSQPAIFVTSIAALNVLAEEIKGSPIGEEGREYFSSVDIKELGMASLGLSLGEITALTASCAVSFEEGLRLVMNRGQFMEEASQKEEGKMASILGLDVEKVEEICKGVGCQIANLNCPGQVVISGPASIVSLASDLAKNSGARRTVMLNVSGAFHSALMMPAKEKLEKVLESIEIKEPAVDFISNVDAAITRDPEKIRKNLADQLDNRTLWEASVKTAYQNGVTEFLEIGPGTVIKGLMKKIDTKLKVTSLSTMEHIKEVLECANADNEVQ